MRVSIVGSGVQGRAIASLLVGDPEVSEIVCSDVNMNKAEAIAEKLEQSGKVCARRVDANDSGELLDVIGEADVVVNATLPRYNLNVMRCALKCGSNYIDLASGGELFDQLELDSEFKRRGLSAAICQGGPFIISTQVKRIAQELDETNEIRLRFGWRWAGEPEPVPTWAPTWCPEVALLEWAERPVVYERGRFKRPERFSGIEEYSFPEPVGRVTVCLIDYEPVWTLPRFIEKGLRRIDCKITLDRLAGALVKLGLAGVEPIEVKGVKVSPLDVLLTLVKQPSEEDVIRKLRDGDVLGCFLAEIEGEKAGEKITHVVYRIFSVKEDFETFGTPWAETAVPVAVLTSMLGRGEIAKGVLPPEGLDPKSFSNALASRGITFEEFRA